MQEAACRIDRVEKAFGDNRVLKDITLDLPAGTVTVLMGANGAGKSTLVKILSGVHSKDSGTIRLSGSEFRPETPADAIRAGIVTVHQNINDGVIPDLDVASNLMIDRLAENSYGFLLKRSKTVQGGGGHCAAHGPAGQCAPTGFRLQHRGPAVDRHRARAVA
jgi:simple sugar transport system ATP-binding protein